MSTSSQSLMLIIASAGELPAAQRIWGTGGWLDPKEREALDWLALATLMGWSTAIAHVSDASNAPVFAEGRKWIVVACDPDELSDELVEILKARLQHEDISILSRAGQPGGKWARFAGTIPQGDAIQGRALQWNGPGPRQSWACRRSLDCGCLSLAPGTAIWATLDDEPVVCARPSGRGHVVTIGFHPGEARDSEGVVNAMLRHLLAFGAALPVAWYDWAGTMVLRMDDPGCSQNLYLREWRHPRLNAEEWGEIGKELRKRQARLSIGYVSGWVDDGESAGTELAIAGQIAARIPGRVHPSPLVHYRDASGADHDYEAEYRAIQKLRTEGLAEVELHGYTHIHPDHEAWLQAADSHESPRWFRELGAAAEPILGRIPLSEHPLALGINAIRQYFQSTPTTLICPGEEFTAPAIEAALDLGIKLVGSYYLGIRVQDRFCWAQHVCAPYLDLPDAAWFDSGLPVVGYFHDRDLALNGVHWFEHCLENWSQAGATRMIGYSLLAAACARQLEVDPTGCIVPQPATRMSGSHVQTMPVIVRSLEAPMGTRAEIHL